MQMLKYLLTSVKEITISKAFPVTWHFMYVKAILIHTPLGVSWISTYIQCMYICMHERFFSIYATCRRLKESIQMLIRLCCQVFLHYPYVGHMAHSHIRCSEKQDECINQQESCWLAKIWAITTKAECLVTFAAQMVEHIFQLKNCRGAEGYKIYHLFSMWMLERQTVDGSFKFVVCIINGNVFPFTIFFLATIQLHFMFCLSYDKPTFSKDFLYWHIFCQ